MQGPQPPRVLGPEAGLTVLSWCCGRHLGRRAGLAQRAGEAGRVGVVPAACQRTATSVSGQRSAGALGQPGVRLGAVLWAVPGPGLPHAPCRAPFVASWPSAAGLGARRAGRPQVPQSLLFPLCAPRNWPLSVVSTGLPGSVACVRVWLVEGTVGRRGGETGGTCSRGCGLPGPLSLPALWGPETYPHPLLAPRQGSRGVIMPQYPLRLG